MVTTICSGVIVAILIVYVIHLQLRVRKLKREAQKFHTLCVLARTRADALSHALWARRAKDLGLPLPPL